VANVPFGDTLNVRKYPSGNVAEAGGLSERDRSADDGRCTGGVNLLDIANQPAWKQEQTGSLSLVRSLA
jgi:hypothetical protein